MISKAKDQIEKQIKESLEGEKKAEQEKLKRIQDENERLKKEKEELERQNKQSPEELLQQHSKAGLEAEQMREYYRGKNEEIEELIESVLKSQAAKEGDGTGAPKDGESLAALLRFLIQLVMK